MPGLARLPRKQLENLLLSLMQRSKNRQEKQDGIALRMGGLNRSSSGDLRKSRRRGRHLQLEAWVSASSMGWLLMALVSTMMNHQAGKGRDIKNYQSG